MRLWPAVFLIALIVVGVPLFGHADERADCFSNGPDDAVLISACTRLIKSGMIRGADLAVAYNQRGLGNERRGEHDQAIADFNESILLNPKAAITFNNRSWAYNNIGQYDRAISDSTEAIKLDRTYTTAYVNRGVGYEKKGEFDQAIANYSEAIKLNQRFAPAYNNRGVCYSNKGEYDRAIQDFNEAIRLQPKEASSYFNRAAAYEKKDELERALANYRVVASLSPGDQAAAAAIRQIEQRLAERNGSDLAIGWNAPTSNPPDKPALGPSTAPPPLIELGRRVALVIGNSAYKKVARLANPANDARMISALFKSAGFDVVQSRYDLDLLSMRRAIRDFSDVARGSDIAVVFFAGHGIEVNGMNYLIPVDATLERDSDVEDEAVSLDRVNQFLEPVKRLRLVILDACRDNTFIPTMKRTSANRSIGRGLARIDDTMADTLIAFSAKAGSTSRDGSGANSPYTEALLKHLATPGLDLRLAFGRVRDEVLASTGRKQEPFLYGSLGGSEISLVARPNAALPTIRAR
jgi:Tfp pilus assembly protein PilF